MSQSQGTSAEPKILPTDATKKESAIKLKNRGNSRHPMKLRVKLPSIESYEKEFVFRAEGPGRVVVRLERLMGTDRVRMMDRKYMTTLFERLEGEEQTAWDVRRASRKKEEHNRSRKLAIEGLMEPSDDMQDLYRHPVFRVNRVLKRLEKFNESMTTEQQINLPPIVPIDPFVNDDSGKIFKSYPGHIPVDVEALSELGSRAELYAELNDTVLSEERMPQTQTKAVEEEEVGEADEEWLGEFESGQERKISLELTLSELQELYGIPPGEDLQGDFEKFQSHLVDLIYTEDISDSTELYDMATEILGVYERENMVADDFVEKMTNILKEALEKKSEMTLNVSAKASAEGAEETGNISVKASAQGVNETQNISVKASAQAVDATENISGKASEQEVEEPENISVKASAQGVDETENISVKASAQEVDETENISVKASAQEVDEIENISEKEPTEEVDATEIVSEEGPTEEVEETQNISEKASAEQTQDISEKVSVSETQNITEKASTENTQNVTEEVSVENTQDTSDGQETFEDEEEE